jgi:hypothetical protein
MSVTPLLEKSVLFLFATGLRPHRRPLQRATCKYMPFAVLGNEHLIIKAMLQEDREGCAVLSSTEYRVQVATQAR